MSYSLEHLATPDTTGLDQYDCWQRAEEAQELVVAMREQAAVYRDSRAPGLHTTIMKLGEFAAQVQERAHRYRQAAEALNSRSEPRLDGKP